MSRDLRSTPLLSALLRALTLLAVIEAIFDRLLEAGHAGSATTAGRLLRAATRAGEFAFVPAFALTTLCLAVLALAALRRPVWPSGPNGFIASTLLCLVLLAMAVVGPAPGPLLVLGFTALSFVALCVVSMQAFAAESSPAARAFAVVYAAAVGCSALGQAIRLTAPDLNPVAAWSAGELLLGIAAILAFLAWFDARDEGASRGRRWLAVALALPAALLFVWARRDGVGPPGLQEGVIGAALFLGAATGIGALLDRERRAMGLGLLYLLLAGFPLRIAYQQLLMVLGGVLLYMPAEAPRRAILILPAPPPAYIPEEEPPARPDARFDEPSVRT